MGLSTDYVHLVYMVLCLVFMNAQGGSPILKLPNPTYYVNQSITISCDSGVSSNLVSVVITINSTDFTYEVECKKSVDGWSSGQQGSNTDICKNLPLSGDVTVQVTTLLIEKMKSSTVTCTVNYFNVTAGLVMPIRATKTNAFSDAYVAPTSLEFNMFEFEGGVPVLNKKTRAHCKSSGGSPPSEYSYEVRSKIESLVYNITVINDGDAEFEITDSLKNGFKVTCRDRVHTMGEISLTKQDCGGAGSEWCLPRYISQKASGSQTVAYNPNYSYTLKCEVESHHTPLITYFWTSNGLVITSENTATYTIAANSSRTLAQETVSCTASLDKYGNVTTTWKITWSLQVTTTTEALAPGTSAASTAIGVGVGVGLAVVIIAIVVGIVLYKKKKDNSARYQNTPPAPDSVTVSKPEKPKKPSSQTTNGGHLAYSKNDDRIIYAELDQHTLGNKQPQPAKPTPKYTQDVVYAEIDPNKTRKLANKNQ